jgi:tRNA G18 (ribose-2'-O)-methylase SpoU
VPRSNEAAGNGPARRTRPGGSPLARERLVRVTSRNAKFQQWEALLGNRNKRQRLGEFLVHGVRPIDAAVANGWDIRALLHGGAATSSWARGLLASEVVAEVVQLAPDLLQELSEKHEDIPELIAVVGIPADDLNRIPVSRNGVVVVLDRPISPGNVGSLVRSADALGVDGVIITGHAADVYDPKAVRASRGSLFAVPAVRVNSPAVAMDWLQAQELAVIGTSEDAADVVWEHDFSGPTALVVGNETTGMSAFWAAACDATVRIPMTGSASSLNATVAASITLYEVVRQRGLLS